MGFKNGCICTVWERQGVVVENKGKTALVNVTTSKKNKQTDRYETDFSGTVMFLGKSLHKLNELNLSSRDRLRLLEVETTTFYDKQNNKNYTNFICWDFEPADDGKKQETTPNKVDVVENATIQPISEEFLPF